MKLKQLLTAVKLGLAVAKTAATGKTAKTLERVEQGLELAEAVKKFVKPPPKK